MKKPRRTSFRGATGQTGVPKTRGLRFGVEIRRVRVRYQALRPGRAPARPEAWYPRMSRFEGVTMALRATEGDESGPQVRARRPRTALTGTRQGGGRDARAPLSP